jgi:hypothetical protein
LAWKAKYASSKDADGRTPTAPRSFSDDASSRRHAVNAQQTITHAGSWCQRLPNTVGSQLHPRYLELEAKVNAQNARAQTSEIKCFIMITLFEAVIFTQ